MYNTMLSSSSRLQLLINEQTGHSLSSSNTHARQQNLLLLPPALAQTCADLPGSCSTKGMTQGNSATSDVHLGMIDAEDILAIDGHGGKRFIDLDDVDVGGQVEVELREQLRNGEGRANTHDSRGNTGDRSSAEFCKDWLVHGEGFRAFHEEDCRS